VCGNPQPFEAGRLAILNILGEFASAAALHRCGAWS
jgi:hypothetical protein